MRGFPYESLSGEKLYGGIMFYVKDGMVFIDLGDDYLLCICSLEEFQKSTVEEVAVIIQQAMAINKYKCIEIWKQPTH